MTVKEKKINKDLEKATFHLMESLLATAKKDPLVIQELIEENEKTIAAFEETIGFLQEKIECIKETIEELNEELDQLGDRRE